MTEPESTPIETLEAEVAQLSQTLKERRLELDTLKLKASGVWLEAGERIVCRVSGCILECLGPRVNEESVFGFDDRGGRNHHGHRRPGLRALSGRI